MRDHSKLRAFQLADELTLRIYAITRRFPDEEKFGLISQLRRAAISVGVNIVEGSARETLPDFIRFLTIAYGSAKELQYEIGLATRLEYLSEHDADELRKLSTRTSKSLWGLISVLRKSTARP